MSISPLKLVKPNSTLNENDFGKYEDANEQPMPEPIIEDMVDANGMLLNQAPAYDRLLNSEVQLQLDE